MKSHLMLGAAVGAILLVTGGHALAADAAAPVATAPAEVSEIDAVIVIGQGQSRQVQTLKNDAIGLEAAGTSPLKAIDKLPGVTFQSADAFGAYEWSARISIRGFNQNQLGFTLDGVPLGDMTYGNHNGLHISRAIASENIGRVELAQGAGALGVASTSNLGGTLQFFSRDPSQEMGGQLDATAGSKAMHRVFGRFDTGAIEQIGGLRGYISFADQKSDKWKGGGEHKQRQYDAKLVMPLGDRGELAGFYHHSERREQDYQDLSFAMIKRLGRNWDNTLPNWGLAVAAARAYQTSTALPAPFATVDDAYYAGAGVRDDDLYGAKLDLDVTDRVTLNATAYQHKNRGQGLWYTPYLASPGFGTAGSTAAPLSIRTTEYDIDRGGLTAGLTIDLGAHKVSGGFWHERNYFNQARRFYAETAAAPSRNPLDFQDSPFFTQWQYAFDTKTLTGHIEDEWTITEAFKVNFGFKAIKVTNKVKTVVGNPLSGEIKSKDTFLPQVGAVYKLTPDFEVFGGYTENMAAYVSAATSGPFSSLNQDNVNRVASSLEPESSKTFELGGRYRTERFQGVAAVYHVTFDNRILAVQQGASIEGNAPVLSNVGSVETKGVELAGTFRMTDAWSLYGAYTYNDSKYESDVVALNGTIQARTKGKTVVNTPKNIFKGEIAFDQGGLFAKLGVAYTDKRYYTYENIGGQAPSTTIADLTLGYRFDETTWGKGLEIQANITNLTNKDYISTIGSGGFVNSDPNGEAMTVLTAPPRQYYVSIKKRF
ncbi:TonB-dependent receptor [Caulobacter sp. RHG1]|uniref:TonB-dependent receptor n=1 Tax=Caulobacter sp. (strain RHG1) TaxID=2545762 RepID=UPI0015577A6E|nr:TonB-dependent receptor [Caulobacter sp. RHG1]NQE60551.1 TonB-dependent receptor [Caulobacter sp. RHG1]